MILEKKCPKPHEGAEIAENWGQIQTPKLPKKTYNNLLCDHIDGFEFFLIFLFLIWVAIPYFKRDNC